MKLSLLAAALVAIALTACDRPKQALPENSTTSGTRTEEGSTLDETRKGPPSEQTAAAHCERVERRDSDNKRHPRPRSPLSERFPHRKKQQPYQCQVLQSSVLQPDSEVREQWIAESKPRHTVES